PGRNRIEPEEPRTMIRRSLLSLALLAAMTACAADAPAGATEARSAAPAAKPRAANAGAPAGDEAIRAALQTLVPGIEVGQIGDSPIPGYRQVALGARVVYVSDDATQLLQGSVIDIASRESLTSLA